MTCDNKLEG